MSAILIVEDDELHRSFLKETVAKTDLKFDRVIEAGDGEQGLTRLAEGDVAAAILDLQMPGRSGVDIARAVWTRNPETPVMFWSNYADEAYVRGIERVAPKQAVYGYLLKSSAEDRLMRTLCAVFLDGQTVIDRQINSIQRSKGADDVVLSPAEYEVLLDIALGLTDGAIAELRSISVRAVQNRLAALYEKFGITASDARLTGGGEILNRRTRTVATALLSRKINGKSLEMAQKDLAEKARSLPHWELRL